MRCEICRRESPRNRMCDACSVSYDRYSHSEASIMGAIIWAARRAHRYSGGMPDHDVRTTMHLRDFVADQLGAVDNSTTIRFLNAANSMLKRWLAAHVRARR